MRLAAPVAVALVCLCLAGAALAESRPYVALGPKETADFEQGLHKLLPVYAYGVGISDSRWATGLKADHLAPEDAARLADYQTKIANWFDDIVVAKLRPQQAEKVTWPAFPRLRHGATVILGRYSSRATEGPYKGATIRFDASDRMLDLTVKSATLFQQPAEALSDDAVIEVLAKVLSIPVATIDEIVVDKRLDSVAGRQVCHGKVRCDYDERAPSQLRHWLDRKWWSVITFWYTRGQLFTSVYTWDFSGGPPKRAWHGWLFEEDYIALRDEQARMPKTEAELRSPLMPDDLIMGGPTTRPVSGGRVGIIKPPNAE